MKRLGITDVQQPQPQSHFVTCWSQDEHARMLRVILANNDQLLLPYQHLVFIRSSKTGNSDHLLLSFTSHEIHVTGNGLEELLLAFNAGSVGWIQPVPNHYQPVGERVVIEVIAVKTVTET